MSKLQRYYNKGTLYFVTSVTRSRNPILVNHAPLLQQALHRAERRFRCEILAWVILPDHFHLLIDTPNQKLSEFMHHTKLSFSAAYRERKGMSCGNFWQSRFWDHVIRDEVDRARHLDYIHFNPVKHGYVARPVDYRHSSFRAWLQDGFYDLEWGTREAVMVEDKFGE